MMQNARMEKYPLKFRIMVVSGSIALMILSAGADAQTAAPGTPQAYPVKALRFILPFPPGGATDAVGRTVIDRLQSALKQNVVADYRPGAGGNLGYGLVAKAPSDGYTLGQCSPSIAISPALYKNPGYDLHDIAPVSLVANIPSLLVVHPSVPANNIKELIALARRNPGKLNFGSGGVGTSNHLAGEMFKSLAKINIVHVPYKGTSVAMFALITGETDLVTIGPPAALPLLRDKRLKALAVLRNKRIAQLPEVPTSAESGLPGWEINTWYGVIAPAATPRDVVTLLNTELVKGLNTPEAHKRLAGVGAEPLLSTVEEFADYLKTETAQFGKLIREAGIRAD
ncbi:MAG TPA: tripartite tricarboxylate transporter substrate binding protein [Burkholderiales bacterium]|nr:tripartite tricarboxylate transporter substrate binding protein [Burkholderiales bacterium]